MTEEEFWAALSPASTPVPPTYRLYYGEAGEPLFYSMESLPGKYVEVTHAIYSNPPKHCKVVNSTLKILNTNSVTKLTLSETGTPCYPDDISIVVDETQPHKKWILK